mmetsp:Transcript_19919/g.49712  ORF Transcript_19919/g.49712 Transcript_19919/m.49712 type:complete len:242 (+) Transcript_19919:2740-3465(+)
MPARVSFASFKSLFAAYFFSYLLATRWCFPSSFFVSLKRVCNSLKVSLCAALASMSLCLSARSLFASATASWVSLRRSTSFSHSSSAMSVSPSLKGSAASAIFFTAASAALTFSLASCIRAVFLRPSVSFLNCPSFAAAVLIRSVSCANSSDADLDAAAPKCLISRFFEAMKVRAVLTDDWSAADAASDSAMVVVASFNASTSMPLRKGNSAWLTLSTPLSTSSAFAFASLTYARLITSSR